MNEYCVKTALFGTVCDRCEGGAIWQIVNVVIKIMTTGIGILAVLGIVIAGIVYLTSSGDTAKLQKAKRRIFEIVIGLAIYAVLFGILEFLIPGDIFASPGDENSACPDIPVTSSPSGSGSSGSSSSSASQATKDNPNPYMTDLIARTAAVMSWPVQKWQSKYDPYYNTSKAYAGASARLTLGGYRGTLYRYYGDGQVDQCYADTQKKFVPYTGAQSDCVKPVDAGGFAITGRASYTLAGEAFPDKIGPYASCDRFVWAVLYLLGLDEGKDFMGPTAIGDWLAGSSNWIQIENTGKTTKLLPGDVFEADYYAPLGYSGHVAIYVGSEYGGKWGTLAEASAGGKFPRITDHLSRAYLFNYNGSYYGASDYQPYRIFRYVGPTTTRAKESLYAGGYQFDELMEDYSTY